MNDFQKRLRKAIEDKGITASELSRLSGVGKSDISNYINGVYVAKQDKVYLLANALGVDPGWLMTGVEPDLSDIIDEKSIEEQILLEKWNQTDEAIKAAVRKLLDMK